METNKLRLCLAASLLALALMPLASAISDQQACTDQGGTYTKVNGTATCTFSETPGNNQGGVTKDTTTSQKGSFSSSHDTTTSDCVNNNGGSHC